MRRFFIALIALVGMGATGLAFAGLADGSGIVDSPHDFTDNECWTGNYTVADDPSTDKTYQTCDETVTTTDGLWNDKGQICAVCHVPHAFGDTQTFRNVGLLWNHDATTVTSWTPYTSGSLEVPAGTSPTGFSLACLGCHDGIGAIDAFDSHAGTGTPLRGIILGSGAGGNSDYDDAVATQEDFRRLVYGTSVVTSNDISSEHPIGVIYDTADPNLHATTNTYGGRTVQDFLDENDRVQCGSCHDPHNNGYAPAAAPNSEYLLREQVRARSGTGGSTLCLGCHDL